MPDDIPSLADLRRTRSKRPAARPTPPTSSPSLFDPSPETVTTADILAEQSPQDNFEPMLRQNC